MNTNVDFEEHTVDKEKRQKKIELGGICAPSSP